VSNLNRPGGNVTGATQLNVEVGPKRLELMRELIPSATDVGLLLNPANVATGAVSTDQQAAANTFGLRLHVVHASSEREIDDAFAKLVQLRARALIIGSDPFFNTRSEQFAALTLRYSMPSIHAYRAFAASGGPISYGGNLEGSYHTAGTYTGRILKGEKPGDPTDIARPCRRGDRVTGRVMFASGHLLQVVFGDAAGQVRSDPKADPISAS
jgi:ABC-type uncharacterized transport system substrate-binding protein